MLTSSGLRNGRFFCCFSCCSEAFTFDTFQVAKTVGRRWTFFILFWKMHEKYVERQSTVVQWQHSSDSGFYYRKNMNNLLSQWNDKFFLPFLIIKRFWNNSMNHGFWESYTRKASKEINSLLLNFKFNNGFKNKLHIYLSQMYPIPHPTTVTSVSINPCTYSKVWKKVCCL